MHVIEVRPLDAEEATRIDACWRGANYLSVGPIYLMGNPLLREPLAPEQVKPQLLGHWGATPGLNLLYVHLSRIVAVRDQDLIYVTGPGHGGPGLVANAWLEGTYSETYPRISVDETGMGRLFTQFSFPGGLPSHVAPETPGSIDEGGELGCSLSHAYGAALDNPNLVVACVTSDGEAGTGPLAASWHSNKFFDDQLSALLTGYGNEPYLVGGADPATVHQQLAAAMDVVFDEIAAIQHAVRVDGTAVRPQWPMFVLRTPKGWTGPREVDGLPMKGTWRVHQVPLSAARDDRGHLVLLEQWMRWYRPDELFGANGSSTPSVVDRLPQDDLRMSANPQTDGGRYPRDLELPDFRIYGVRAGVAAQATRVLGGWLRDVVTANEPRRNVRIVGPDETESNRLGVVLDVTDKAWQATVAPVDQRLGRHGRVMEIHPSTPARAGWRATSPPAGTARSCANRWSTSAPEHHACIRRAGEDLPEVRDRTWPTA